MTAKEYLSQIRQMRSRLQVLQDEIATIRSQAESVRGMDYDKVRVQSSPDMDPLATYLGQLTEAEEELSTELEQYLAIYTQIFRQIANLGMGIYADVLFMRYFENKTLAEIAEDLQYSHDRIRHIHGVALQEFEHKYLHDEK